MYLSHSFNCGCWSGWYHEWSLCVLVLTETLIKYDAPNFRNWWYMNAIRSN